MTGNIRTTFDLQKLTKLIFYRHFTKKNMASAAPFCVCCRQNLQEIATEYAEATSPHPEDCA